MAESLKSNRSLGIKVILDINIAPWKYRITSKYPYYKNSMRNCKFCVKNVLTSPSTCNNWWRSIKMRRLVYCPSVVCWQCSWSHLHLQATPSLLVTMRTIVSPPSTPHLSSDLISLCVCRFPPPCWLSSPPWLGVSRPGRSDLWSTPSPSLTQHLHCGLTGLAQAD